MSTLLLTMAGQSTRYPNERPKWALTDPSGNMMAAESIRLLEGYERIVVGINSLASSRYGADVIAHEFKLAGHDVDVYDVGSTKSQVESAVRLLELAKVQGAFTIKDCDNRFAAKLPSWNAVAYVDLHNVESINPGNKSYVELDENNRVTDIQEKRIVSPYFCCGAYSFDNAKEFVLAAPDVEYVSQVIDQMLYNGVEFMAYEAEQYEDWGTAEDWKNYRARFKTLFVDIDGVLVRASHRSFAPRWGDSETIDENVEYLNALHDTGTVEIVLTTSRSPEYRKATERQLMDLRYDRLIMGLQGGARVLVNDVVPSRNEQTCYAINIERNTSELEQEMKAVS